jgi:non-homologous end joining protein Ku
VDLHFAPAKSVNTAGGVGKHYVTAREGYEDKLRLLVEAMKKSKTVFVAKWVPVSRQALVVGMVENDGLVLVQIPFAAQRKEQPEVQGSKPEAKMVGMAVKLIENSMDENFVDTAIDEGVELKKGAIQAVIDGKPVKQQKAKPVAKAEDLEDLLAASLN